MTCRLTHNNEPLGIQMTSMLERELVPQDFQDFMDKESSSEKKRKYKLAL